MISVPAVVNLRCIIEYGSVYSLVGAPPRPKQYSSSTSWSHHVLFFLVILVFVAGTFSVGSEQDPSYEGLSQDGSWKGKHTNTEDEYKG